MSWQGKEKETATMDLSLYPAGIQVVLVCHTQNCGFFHKNLQTPTWRSSLSTYSLQQYKIRLFFFMVFPRVEGL